MGEEERLRSRQRSTEDASARRQVADGALQAVDEDEGRAEPEGGKIPLLPPRAPDQKLPRAERRSRGGGETRDEAPVERVGERESDDAATNSSPSVTTS